MLSWLMANYYDAMLRDAETKCLQDWRKTLLQDLSGDVLDLGCGTGANLPFYSERINRLVLVEPSQYMRRKLNAKLSCHPHLPSSIKNCTAEAISFRSGSMDAVVSTLLLCSVKNPEDALAEIRRVLRPGGKLIFIEHVAAHNRPERLKWQRRIEPFWKLLQCGCHLTRDTETAIQNAGSTIQTINRESMRGVPPIARPSIWGVAVKRS